MTLEEYKEHLHKLDMEGVAALFDAAHEYHKKRARSGGAAICICGMGSGGSKPCRGLRVLRDLFMHEWGSEKGHEQWERIQRVMDR